MAAPAGKSGPAHEDRPPTLRDRLYLIVFEADTPAGKTFDILLIIAIFASVIVVMLSTLKDARAEPYRTAFRAAEWAFTAIFTVEYVLRLWIARRPLRYAVSFYGVIDLLAILPAFIGLLVPGGERLLVVRTLRMLRIFRVLKLTRYLSEAAALRQAVYQGRQKIAVFLSTVLIVVLITSAIMHIVEGNAGNEAFQNLPESMYWAIITMTTVGYGDITPITPIGKAVTAMLVLIGYSLIIVPTGILSAEMASERFGRQRVTTRACPHCLREGHDAEAKFCKHCGGAME